MSLSWAFSLFCCAYHCTMQEKELKQKERKNRDLQKERNIKERALAETAALLVLRKKARAIWGTARALDQCLRSQDSNRTDR